MVIELMEKKSLEQLGRVEYVSHATEDASLIHLSQVIRRCGADY